MPDGIEIKINGIDEVNKALYKYSQQLGDKVVIQSLRQGAKLVQKSARTGAPKRTGRLKRAIVVKNSKIYNKRRTPDMLGVYLGLRKGKGKDDPKDGFYGRFQEDGWNVRGKYQAGSRSLIKRRFGSRTGRKTLPGRRNVPGKKFIKNAFHRNRGRAARLIVMSAERGAEIVARKTGLKS